MGMTRGQMLDAISSRELMEQMAHDHLTNTEADDAARGQELLSAAKASVGKQLASRR